MDRTTSVTPDEIKGILSITDRNSPSLPSFPGHTYLSFPFSDGFRVGLMALLPSYTFSFTRLALLLLEMKSGCAVDEDVGVAGKFKSDGGGLAPLGIFGFGTRFPSGGVASVITGSTFERLE